jgi:defect-in-organelle-trafficking protein DotC
MKILKLCSLAILISFNVYSNRSPNVVSGEGRLYTLDELQNIQLQTKEIKNEELAIRVEAIKEHAEEIGSAHGYIETMNHLMSIVERNKLTFDGLHPFPELVNAAANLNVGEAKFVLPGMVDKIEAHAAIDETRENSLIRTDDIVYRLRAQPRPILRSLHWSDYLYEEANIKPIEIVYDLLPANEEEMEAYQIAIREGWSMGREQAIEEMRSRIINAFVDATAMARYINLVESNYINKPDLVIENLGVVIQGDQMGLGTQLISLDGGATWQPNSDLFNSPIIEVPRNSIRRDLITELEAGQRNRDLFDTLDIK